MVPVTLQYLSAALVFAKPPRFTLNLLIVLYSIELTGVHAPQTSHMRFTQRGMVFSLPSYEHIVKSEACASRPLGHCPPGHWP